jgi:hypothetical protein
MFLFYESNRRRKQGEEEIFFKNNGAPWVIGRDRLAGNRSLSETFFIFSLKYEIFLSVRRGSMR